MATLQAFFDAGSSPARAAEVAAGARQHGHAAPGARGPAAGQGLELPRARAGGPARPAAAPPHRRRSATEVPPPTLGPVPTTLALPILAAEEWTARAAAHEARIDRWTAPHRERRRRGETHPVLDFLFTYYSEPPGRLRRWHPGPDVALGGPALRTPPGAGTPGRRRHRAPRRRRLPGRPRRHRPLRPPAARGHRRRARPSAAASACTSGRWSTATGSTRHPVPLRLGQAGTDAVVEAHPIRCTHFDAFRFFTPDAVRPQPPAADPGDASPSSSSRAACTPAWTSTSGPTSSARPPRVSWSRTASSSPSRSGSWTCGPPPTTCAPTATSRSRSRRRRARPPTSPPSAASPSAAPSSGPRLLEVCDGITSSSSVPDAVPSAEVTSTRTGRWVRLDGTTNTRDLGGLPTTDGGPHGARAGSCAATTCRPSARTTSGGWSRRSACAR